MSETLRIAPADATKPTWRDLRGYLISGSRMINEVFSASTIIEIFRDIQEGVDADVVVDAQNAPTATLKTADSVPQAPTPIIFLAGRNRNENSHPKNQQPTVTHVPGLICHPCPRPFMRDTLD